MASELNRLTLGSRTLVAVVFPKPIKAFRLIQNYLRVFFRGLVVNLKDENMPVNRKVLEKLPMSFTSFAVITGSVLL